jgi:hypothetical protein
LIRQACRRDPSASVPDSAADWLISGSKVPIDPGIASPWSMSSILMVSCFKVHGHHEAEQSTSQVRVALRRLPDRRRRGILRSSDQFLPNHGPLSSFQRRVEGAGGSTEQCEARRELFRPRLVGSLGRVFNQSIKI